MISPNQERVDSFWICGVSENFPDEFFEEECHHGDDEFAVSSSQSFSSAKSNEDSCGHSGKADSQNEQSDEEKRKEQDTTLCHNYVIDCIWLCSSGWVENKYLQSDEREATNTSMHSQSSEIIPKGRPIDKSMFKYLDRYYKNEFE